VDAGGPDAGRDAGPLDAGGDAGGDVDGGPGDAGGDAGTDGGPPVGPVEVAAGAGHSCARLADGTVRCWGRNGSRQIGDGSTVATQSTPQLAVGLADAASIGLGDAHSCAVRAGGTAVCWGSNVSGQVGNGDTLTFGGINMPTPVMDLTDAVVVRGGLAHTCASVSDDTMKCWGRNSAGQLGDATVTRRTTPVNVWLLSDVAAIATGSEHSCAVLGDGTVRCWGENGRGQLGDGGRTDANMPVPVTSMAGAIDLAAGSTHTCALRMDGSVWCWGENTSGQLGTDMGGLGTPDSLVPVQVVRLDDAIAIAAGFDSTCAIRSGGAAVCWGDNTDGRLGTGTAASREEGPTAVSALTGVTSIAVGGGHGCAVADPAATVYCWGTNGSGQLGTGGTPASSTVPIPVDL
jgi:alpha-tubulin suppressor-like RCC1 family protein